MKRIVSSTLSVLVSFAVVVGGASIAAAQPSAAKPAPVAAAGASAEVKAGTGVENKESVGTASEFAAGTKVYVWTRVLNAPGAATMVWKLNGTENWKAKVKIGSKRWTTSSRRQVKAGSWTVEVQGADGSVLGSVDFTVK